MLIEKNIVLYFTCEHHFLPIVGRAHVGYISNGRVLGLSKMNRIVDYFARRPQVQERLTMQIVQEMQRILGTEDVASIHLETLIVTSDDVFTSLEELHKSDCGYNSCIFKCDNELVDKVWKHDLSCLR